jgi:MYXO-CTERM domain-containing protein
VNFLKTTTLILASLAFPVISQAITFSTDFNSGPVNFAPVGPWSINDPESEVSFRVSGPGGANYVALGGFQSAPSQQFVNLSASLAPGAVPTNGSVFTSRFAIINSGQGFNSNNIPPTNDPDDNFGFTLRDTSGGFFSVSVRPTVSESIRQFFTSNSAFGFDPVPVLGMGASDYSNPAFVTMTLNFNQNGANLDYVGNLATAGAPINFSGSLAGFAGRSWSSFEIDFDVKDNAVTGGLYNGAGRNVIMVDSVSLVPEPSAAMMGLLSVGLLGLRRRR